MVYKRIKDLREDKDITQAYISKKLNISQRTYSYYERGEHSIPPELLSAIADFYNTSVDYLLNRTNITVPYPK
ncbi:MAG: helix-turn-helix transcriptional regulator [Firmicutes bacterium]|nr:helix-turn-helix transcriptional regulator [Bacillota bacterium]